MIERQAAVTVAETASNAGRVRIGMVTPLR